MICASLALLHLLLSLTHWIFRSLMLPYKSSSHSANHVRCASLRSGGRRLAVRKTIEYQIGVLPRTPFPASRDFPSRGNKKIGGTGYCVTYDTDSQSRNASCVPFRGRGPQSGEGVDGGNPDYDTRCGRDCRRWPSGPWCQGLCRKAASLRSGGRRLAVRKTIEYQIGALPRTPFPAAREFPSRGNEKDGEEKQRVIYFMYHSAVFSPLFWW